MKILFCLLLKANTYVLHFSFPVVLSAYHCYVLQLKFTGSLQIGFAFTPSHFLPQTTKGRSLQTNQNSDFNKLRTNCSL